VSIVVMLSRATRNEKHLWSLLRMRLERANLGHGVDGIAMIAAHTARLKHEQTQNLGPARALVRGRVLRARRLIDTIANRWDATRRCGLKPLNRTCQSERFALCLHAAKRGGVIRLQARSLLLPAPRGSLHDPSRRR
jgi:hypothetical protein